MLPQQSMFLQIRLFPVHRIWSKPKMSLAPSNILRDNLFPFHGLVYRINFESSIVGTGFINVFDGKRVTTKNTHFCYLAFCHFLQNLIIWLLYWFLFDHGIFFSFFYFSLPMFNRLLDKLVHKVGLLLILRQSRHFLLSLQKLSWKGSIVCLLGR